MPQPAAVHHVGVGSGELLFPAHRRLPVGGFLDDTAQAVDQSAEGSRPLPSFCSPCVRVSQDGVRNRLRPKSGFAAVHCSQVLSDRRPPPPEADTDPNVPPPEIGVVVQRGLCSRRRRRAVGAKPASCAGDVVRREDRDTCLGRARTLSGEPAAGLLGDAIAAITGRPYEHRFADSLELSEYLRVGLVCFGARGDGDEPGEAAGLALVTEL